MLLPGDLALPLDLAPDPSLNNFDPSVLLPLLFASFPFDALEWSFNTIISLQSTTRVQTKIFVNQTNYYHIIKE